MEKRPEDPGHDWCGMNRHLNELEAALERKRFLDEVLKTYLREQRLADKKFPLNH